MAQRSGINRSLMWLRKVLEITEETDSPRVLSEIAQPSIDLFGWERRTRDAITTNANGALAAALVLLPAVPDDVMRFVINASLQSDDAAQVAFLSMQVRNSGIDVAVQEPFLIDANGANVRVGLVKPLLLEPGDIFMGVSSTAPAAGQRLSMRYRHIDLDFGEYMATL